ncbi:hypothetical protein ACFSO7_04480 [Bacillus sp. CGMCC 1.16607]|uniref:hypothetical protein n=1 Tax=Bacillus sp. CGMCC 1.16607 TaxID=3351842 RepID=UPI003631180B
MGYLLPLTPYQEMQYQNRDMKFTSRYVQTFPIAPLQRVAREDHFNHDPRHKTFRKKTNAEMKLIGEITGKGIYFDEWI